MLSVKLYRERQDSEDSIRTMQLTALCLVEKRGCDPPKPYPPLSYCDESSHLLRASVPQTLVGTCDVDSGLMFNGTCGCVCKPNTHTRAGQEREVCDLGGGGNRNKVRNSLNSERLRGQKPWDRKAFKR